MERFIFERYFFNETISMNILFFTESGLGISALATDQICELKKQNNHTFGAVSSMEQEPGLINKMINSNIGLLKLPGLESHKNLRKHIYSVKQFVKQRNIDIIHVQTNWELVLCFFVQILLLFSHKLQIIYTVHAFRHNKRFQKYIALFVINILLFFMANRVICTCKYTKKLFPLVRSKTFLIPLGIDDSYFSDRREVAHDAGVSLIFPAQFREGKRQDMIVRAFAKYVSKSGDKDSVVILPGEGPMKGRVKELAVSLGIGDRVIMPGHCSKAQVRELYSKVTIAVVSSNRETFGQSIVEPYVLGKVVISTPVGIAPELIDGHEGGFIFRTEYELCEILCRLAKHPELIDSIGKGNFDKRMRFSWQHITAQYLDALRDLL